MKKVKLETLCKIASSKRIFEKEYVSSGIPFIRGKEVSDGSLLNSKKFECYISQSRFEELKTTYGVPTVGDILITAVGTIGNLCYLNKKIDFYFKDGNIIWFSNFNKDIYSKYLFFFMKSNFFKAQLNNKRIGAVQKAITIDMLKNIELNLPDYSTQQKIAAILSSLDDKIETNNKIASVLEKMMKEIYDYWFVQFDFPGIDGKPYQSSGGEMVYNPTLKREIPKGWEVKKLEDIFLFEKGTEPGSKAYKNEKTENAILFYRVGDINSTATTTFVDLQNKLKIVEEDNVIVSFDGTVGKVDYGLNGAISSGLRHIYDKSKEYSNALVFNIFKDEKILETIKKYATGSNILHASSSISHLFIPFNEKQIKHFQSAVEPMFKQMIELKKQTQTLTALRDFLLPLLMNGQSKIK